MSGVGDILWTPDPDRIAGARISAFIAAMNERHGLSLAGYPDLYDWSVAHRGEFWGGVWDFCGVVGDGPGATVLDDPGPMPGARWFPEARLNFAENLLQWRGPDPALIFRREDGRSGVWSRDELRSVVGRTARALAAEGVGPGDRVAGFLPNRPETVAAMLATAALGAVWSSCSPDFGSQGVLDRFGQIEPKVLFATDGYVYGGARIGTTSTVEMLRSRLGSLSRLVLVPESEPGLLPEGTVLWDDYIAPFAGEDPDYLRVPFSHPLFIMYSSGTTGLPKCMVHTVGGTLLQHLKEHQLHCDLKPGERIFYFTTCGWMMWNWLVSGLASGAALVLYDGGPFTPRSALWDLVQDLEVAVMGVSARWLAASEKFGLRPAQTHDLGALRAVLSTGSPLSPESFDYVYRDVKRDVQLSSISGGTDIVSCFALGCPILPVRRGELQCRGLGMKVEVRDPQGRPLERGKGELVCTAAFPSMPSGFWADPDGSRYHEAYFARFPGIWHHGDFAESMPGGGMVIHGRSDTVLNPGGVRIGTAEIYRIVDRFPEVRESLAVGLQRDGDVKIALFVVLGEDEILTPGLVESMKRCIREEESPRHVPAFILQAPAVPRTISGKTVELAVRRILHGDAVDNTEALANPESLDFFRDVARRLSL